MITIVINSLGRGGAERSILLLAEELLRRGEEVQIVCLFEISDEYLVSKVLQSRLRRLKSHSVWMAIVRLRSCLLKRRPRVVFSLMPQSNLAAWLVGISMGLPVLTSERTTPTLFYRSRLKLFLSLLPHAFSRRAVFISHYALDNGLPANALGRAVHRNACVLHNPVLSPISWAEARDSRRVRVQRLRAWARNDGKVAQPLRLLLASRLVDGKGVLEFVEAARELLLNGSLVLAVAGTGPLEEPLLALVERHGLAEHVRIHGFLEDIHVAYAATDVVILSSKSEGFGRVGFEAYQAGCLVLGLPHNSFASELLAESPAWQVVPALTQLKSALLGFAAASIPEGGEDMVAMREALGIERHAQNFIDIVCRAAPHV